MRRAAPLVLLLLLSSMGAAQSQNDTNGAPTASFEARIDGMRVYLNASNSSDPDDDRLQYNWSFGDNRFAAGVVVNHTYEAAGEYEIILHVADTAGKSDTATKTIHIKSQDDSGTRVCIQAVNCGPPTAHFEYRTINQTIFVDASNSFDPDGGNLTYNWSFGDGNKGHSVRADHTYETGGGYNVTLLVTDEQGDNDTLTRPVKIPHRDPCRVDPETCKERQEDRFSAYCRDHPGEEACDDYERYKQYNDNGTFDREAYCRDHPEDDRCPRRNNESTPPQERFPQRDAAATAVERVVDTCRRDAAEPKRFLVCQNMDVIAATLRQHSWVTYTVDDDGLGIQDYRIRDRLVLEALRYQGDGDASMEVATDTSRTGHVTRVSFNGEGQIAIADNPTGLITFQGEGSLHLRFPDAAAIDNTEFGSRVILDSVTLHLVGEQVEWDGTTATATGSAKIHVAPPRPGTEERAAATQGPDRHLGARVALRAVASDTVIEPEGAVEVLAYENIAIEVDRPREVNPDAPLRVQFEAHLDEGRTIIVDVEDDLLPTRNVDVHYFDIHQRGKQTLETEVFIQQASTLEDVLDPTDDAGQPEYWITWDQQGAQILVSVPVWSAHAITVASIAEIVKERPVLTLGILAGIAGSAFAAAIMFWPRRPSD